MKVYKVTDKEFCDYGVVLEFNFDSLIERLNIKNCPMVDTLYVASDGDLENTAEADYLRNVCFGGTDIQIGYCNGHNRDLNCLEYHMSSELDIAANDLILLLGKRQEIKNGQYDTKNVKAFLLPAGTGVELFATTLHYCPCGINGKGFRMAVVLPRGTNGGKPAGDLPAIVAGNNKFLLAHEKSPEAKKGAFIGLVGDNLRV